MEKAFVRYTVGTYMYVALRNAVYAPPMKKEEYVTDRVGRAAMYTLAAPFTATFWMWADIKNLEHIARKMPGPIDRSPWS